MTTMQKIALRHAAGAIHENTYQDRLIHRADGGLLLSHKPRPLSWEALAYELEREPNGNEQAEYGLTYRLAVECAVAQDNLASR